MKIKKKYTGHSLIGTWPKIQLIHINGADMRFVNGRYGSITIIGWSTTQTVTAYALLQLMEDSI